MLLLSTIITRSEEIVRSLNVFPYGSSNSLTSCPVAHQLRMQYCVWSCLDCQQSLIFLLNHSRSRARPMG